MKIGAFLASYNAYSQYSNLGAWSKVNGSDTNVYPSLSGMVATPNSRGAWYGFKPSVGTRYDAEYDGMKISVMNNGDGSYALTYNGNTSRRQYDPRWTAGVYFDAQGNAISSPESASDMSAPGQAYYNHGVIAAESASVNKTSASDGSNNIWASESGIAGVVNKYNAWVLFVPPTNLLIQSFYMNRQIAVSNNGDGTYFLTLDGQTTRRVYANNFKSGILYDARGNQISSPDSARIEMNPAQMFFTPGAIASAAVSAPVAAIPSPVSNAGTLAPSSGSVSFAPSGAVTSLSPIFPSPGDASWVSGTFPDIETTENVQPVSAGVDGKTLLAIAALALTALN